jgi:hypothetical protein
MPALQRKYPRLERCVYYVHLKNGRVIGPFREGEWNVENVPAGRKTEQRVLLRFILVPPTNGSIALNGSEIDRVEVRCPPPVAHQPVAAPTGLVPGGTTTGPTTTSGTGTGTGTGASTTPPAGCSNGSRKEELAETTETDYVRTRVKEEQPTLADAILDKISEYLPSVEHVKCWMYAYYEKTTTRKYRKSVCRNGKWVDDGTRVEREVETVKVRLAFGGVPCQNFPPDFAPRNYPGFDGNFDFGWVESTSTQTH